MSAPRSSAASSPPSEMRADRDRGADLPAHPARLRPSLPRRRHLDPGRRSHPRRQGPGDRLGEADREAQRAADHGRRHAHRRAAVDAERPEADRRPGRHVQQRLRQPAAVLPGACLGDDRPLPAQPRGLVARGAVGLQRAARRGHPARVDAARRLLQHLHGQVPQRLRLDARARQEDRHLHAVLPAGLGPVARLGRRRHGPRRPAGRRHLPLLRHHAQRQLQRLPAAGADVPDDGLRQAGQRAAGRRQGPGEAVVQLRLVHRAAPRFARGVRRPRLPGHPGPAGADLGCVRQVHQEGARRRLARP